MKKLFWLILFLFPLISNAQCPQIEPCQDTLREPDIYHPISPDYSPVCGCDGVTYRNCDAAYWWGAINRSDDNGSCEAFDVDLSPNIFTPFDRFDERLKIYMGITGTVSVQIYSAFGRIMFEKDFPKSIFSGMKKSDRIIKYDLREPETFPKGVYLLIVSIGGERKHKKFIKLDY
jgi:hypothetical protein